jgi:hypothetical protein
LTFRAACVDIDPMTIADFIGEQFEDERILKADGYDDCVIGHTGGSGPTRLIYSVSKILAKLAAEFSRDQTLGPDDDPATMAREYFDFNIAGSYVGEHTPVWCEDEILETYAQTKA